MAGQRNILFSATFHSSFIDRDLELLSRQFKVLPVFSHGLMTPLSYARRLRSAAVTFSWFASVYSSLLIGMTKLSGTPSILVLGGVDVADDKELNYGIWNSWWKARLVRYAITHADVVLAVDEFVRREAIRLAGFGGENIIVVPTGYDPDYWSPKEGKQELILCVAHCPNSMRAKLKGIDLFFAAARKLPGKRFRVIGVKSEVASALSLPENVECLPFSSADVVRSSCQEAAVYCQLSSRDAFPNALCEAMLCECVPVGTRVGGIPTAIGDAGFLVDYADVAKTVDAIQKALSDDGSIGKKARSRIKHQFGIERREASLLETIGRLVR